MIKEGLQPYPVKRLVVHDYYLEKTLSIVTPSDELVVKLSKLLSEEQIRAIESLAVKRLEVHSFIYRDVLEQINAINVQNKYVSG